MLRTSFIVMYKILGVLGMAGLQVMALQSKVALQSSFQSLATSPASATGFWSEEKASEGGEKQGVGGRAKEETKDGEWNEGGIDLLFN